MQKKIAKAVAMTLASVMVFSVSVPAASAKVSKVTVQSLTGSKKVVYVAKGKKVKVKVTVSVKPNKSANKKVTYKISDKKIATVTSKGYIKGKTAGTTYLTVTSKLNPKKSTKIKVKVVKKPIKKLTLNITKTTLAPGDTLKLKVKKYSPSKNIAKVVKFTSNKKSVAKVTKKGKVTAVACGTAKITCKALDGSKKKATCTITVSNESTSKLTLPTADASGNADAYASIYDGVKFLDVDTAAASIDSLIKDNLSVFGAEGMTVSTAVNGKTLEATFTSTGYTLKKNGKAVTVAGVLKQVNKDQTVTRKDLLTYAKVTKSISIVRLAIAANTKTYSFGSVEIVLKDGTKKTITNVTASNGVITFVEDGNIYTVSIATDNTISVSGVNPENTVGYKLIQQTVE